MPIQPMPWHDGPNSQWKWPMSVQTGKIGWLQHDLGCCLYDTQQQRCRTGLGLINLRQQMERRDQLTHHIWVVKVLEMFQSLVNQLFCIWD
jgi:hypothetical protein